MPYDFHWHDEQHSIIRLDMHGEVTWDALYAAIDNICSELDRSPYRVDIILNDTVGMPKGNPMPHLRSFISRLHKYENIGLIITVTANNASIFIRTIISVVMRVMKVTGRDAGIFVDSLDEAIDMIQKDRETATDNKIIV